jgi:hypothetical protein
MLTVTFSGPPGCGKTLSLRKAEELLKTAGFRVCTYDDGADRARPAKTALREVRCQVLLVANSHSAAPRLVVEYDGTGIRTKVQECVTEAMQETKLRIARRTTAH